MPHLDAGVEAIVMTASGCGVMVKDYGWLLRNDPAYAEKAARVSAATKDISEVLVTGAKPCRGSPLSAHALHQENRLPPALHPAARAETWAASRRC
jgi:glycolate oxidase iron-sulfur subunit